MKTMAANKHGGNVTLELKALRMKDGNKKYFCEARTSEDGSRVKSTSVMVRGYQIYSNQLPMLLFCALYVSLP